MKNLFEMLQAIFGKNIISGTIGTRTNVIKLPTNKSSPLKNEFDVFKSAENPAVFEKLKKVIEDEAPYISRMNDAERLIYEGNVKRLHDYLVSIGEIKPAITAEVIGLTTKEPIAGKGLASLVEEAGQTSPPGTLIGDIQSRINRLKNLAKEEGKTMQDVVGDFASGQKGMLKLQDEGLVRATARQIMFNDIKSGKLKASKEVQDIVSGRASGDPLDSFRTIYGEDALEQLDSLTPDLRQLRTEVDAEKLARSKFEFTPKLDRPKESYTPEEMEKILKEGEEEGTKGLDYLTGQKPPEKKANGGRIGFSIGGGKKILDLIAKMNKKLKDKKSMETVNPKTGEVTIPKEPVTTAEKKYFYDKNEEYNKLIKKHKKAAEAHDQLDNIDIYDKIAPDQLGEVIAEMAGKNVDKLTDAQRRKYYIEAQTYLTDFIKIDRTRRAVEKANKGLELTATDRLYLKFAQPETKSTYKQGDIITSENFGDTPFAPSQETLDNLKKAREISDEPIPGAFSFNDPEIKAGMEEAMQEAKKRGDEMRKMGLDPASGRDYDKYIEIKTKSGDKDFNKYFDDLEIKTRFKGIISDDLLQKILTDDNPQRKAEVIATIEQGLTMQEKGMAAEEIVDILKNAPRTKQAKGGSVGLGYLVGE